MTDAPLTHNPRIAIIGLGYVGLPLAVAFGQCYDTIGFDINPDRINELTERRDSTLEVSEEELATAAKLTFTETADDAKTCNIYIVTVPTPVDEFKRPDLTPLWSASISIAPLLSAGDIVVYESTVYPGATEEECVPLLEKHSGLTFNKDFFVGYSPERINPGDKKHRLENIVKVTSGSTPETAEAVDKLYSSIIKVGTHKAPSIKVAEAAKIIENTQRDINIALMNELALIFDKLRIDTKAVLDAAGTKWNFLPFKPGLVGGHCIGVDPYYLTHKAQAIGHHPAIILSGRRINDGMGRFVAESVAKIMTRKRIHVVGASVLLMGLTFKENCPDLRNSGVAGIISELTDYNCNLDVHDPWALPHEAKQEFGIDLVEKPIKGKYDAIIIAVAHSQFVDLSIDNIHAFGKPNHVLYDVKNLFEPNESDGRL